TSSKPPQEILDQLVEVLAANAVEFYQQESPYSLCCQANGKPQIVQFQVEICQVPRMNLHGLHFKRISGGVWNYKKVCSKL
ncbi:KA1 domain/Ssp2 C-terminal domain-containing protein, partial [Gorgonomyces haynaldii]